MIEEAPLEEVEQESVEEESILTEYDPDDFLSGAVNSFDSTIPLDLFEFKYPFFNNLLCLLVNNYCNCVCLNTNKSP